MFQKIIFVINPYCHQGKGWKRWLLIRNEVFKRIASPALEIVLEKGATLEQQLIPLLTPDVKSCIISAGGDGTINTLINYLLKLHKSLKEQVTLGAIGLGSSNDFLKPFGHKILQVPVRININHEPVWHDVGLIKYRKSLVAREKYFIVNASLGATAAANFTFNHPDKILKFLKSYFTQLGILYAALKTISLFTNISCSIEYNQQKSVISMSNINVLKSPFVSGSIHYNQEIGKDDGNLALNICEGMSRWQLIKTLIGLQQGYFPQTPNTSSAIIQGLYLKSDSPLTFEYDGETDQAKTIEIKIIPKAIKILKS